MCDAIVKIDYCRAIIQADLAQFKDDLLPLESGELHVAERLGDGAWVDVTDGVVASHKRAIATFEALLEALQERAVE